MANIKILKPEVFNKISAGEVVETPSGALKELVENSIDAGATRITIEIKNGGLELISIADNGCGIREDDIDLAFYKHATSKLSTAEELLAIQTLGFRGEALSSIAAVSRIKLITRHASSDAGTLAIIEDGITQSKQLVSANIGTKMEVRDLFYNMPARKKFLKTPKYEGTSVTKYVTKLILTNPTLEITYIQDGVTVYQSKGTGLKDAIFSIYGKECVDNCLPIDFERGILRVNGYVGTYNYSKANRNYQTLSVNGRLVEDGGVSGAILQAYRPYLMSRRFPFFVLNIDMPCDFVDVNVHPKKSEVRFSDAKAVCSAFYRATSDALKHYQDSLIYSSILTSKPESAEELTEKVDKQEKIATRMEQFLEDRQFNVMNSGQTADVVEIERATDEIDREREFLQFALEMNNEISVEKARKKMGFVDDEPKPKVAQKKAIVNSPSIEEEIAQMMPPLVAEANIYDDLYRRTRILGAAFKTYLILEIEDKIIVVDQHAAHERILFDKFMQAKVNDMQSLIIPYVFQVKEDESEFIDENIENIKQAGFEIEPFGLNTYRITAVSTLLSRVRMNEFVEYLLSSVNDFKLDNRALIVEKIAQKACKAAVKGGDCMNEYEIKYILKEVYENNVLQCPHGRPVSVVYTKSQIEKLFKRIV